MSKVSPYISVVVSGRNDNYGGDFLVRIQNQISWLGELADRHKLPVEYVLVNYNPILDQPTLKETLTWPSSKYFSVLQVTLPSSIHQKYVNPNLRKSVPLYEFIAKNAGIRRSTAPFILTTNADILFHPSLIKELAEQRLENDRLYRTDRLDHRHKEPFHSGIEQYLIQIERSVFKFFFKGGTYSLKPSSIPFSVLKNWHRIVILPIKHTIRFLTTTISSIGFPVEFVTAESLQPCNASGDFLLAHRDHYHRLRGFPEDTYISTHTDSLMVYKFITAGLKVKEYHFPVFHADHERRFKFDTPLGDQDMANMYARLQKEIGEMNRKGAPTLHNEDTWGLAQYELPIEKW